LASAHAAGGRALAEELLLELGVPVVLDVIVCPSRQLRRDDRPPASMLAYISYLEKLKRIGGGEPEIRTRCMR
jgi:hypothetical protein